MKSFSFEVVSIIYIPEPKWSEWVKDGDCSSLCNGGQQEYTRNCAPGEKVSACVDDGFGTTKTEPCNTQSCDATTASKF